MSFRNSEIIRVELSGKSSAQKPDAPPLPDDTRISCAGKIIVQGRDGRVQTSGTALSAGSELGSKVAHFRFF